MWLSRPIERGDHAPHELCQLRHELGDACSCGDFGLRRQLLNLCSDTHVGFVDRIHLLQSFQQVAPLGALPDSGLNVPLKKFLFERFSNERAFGPYIRVLLTDIETCVGATCFRAVLNFWNIWS